MATLGINVSDRDPVIGWECIQPVRKSKKPEPIQILIEQVEFAWKKQLELADRLEDGEDVREELFQATLVAETLAARLRVMLQTAYMDTPDEQ